MPSQGLFQKRASSERSVGSEDVGKTHSGAAEYRCQRAPLALGQRGNEDRCVSVGLLAGLSYPSHARKRAPLDPRGRSAPVLCTLYSGIHKSGRPACNQNVKSRCGAIRGMSLLS